MSDSFDLRADLAAGVRDAAGAWRYGSHRLPMPGYPFWAVPDGGPVRWFEGPGAILRDDCGTWVWARAGSADDLAAARRTLPATG